MSYKEQIEQLTMAYNGLRESHEQEVSTFLKDGVKEVGRVNETVLMQEIKEQLATMRKQFEEQATNLNNRLQVIIEGFKDELLPDEATRSSDHAANVANAIKFIELEGEAINDDVAYTILKDFHDDLDTMRLFKRMIGKIKELENSNGDSNFPKTFGSLNRNEYIFNTLTEMEATAEYLFIDSLSNSNENYIIYNVTFSVTSLPSFRQVEGEQLILKLANELDEAVNAA